MRICVFELDSSYPKLVNKQRAKRLVASGNYRWNGPQAIQALPPRIKSDVELRFTYIPDKLPPMEVPGVYFQEPQSDQWRKEHRSGMQGQISL